MPYADWLVRSDRFDEALEAYRQADRPDQALHLLQQLTQNAVVENRFKDAACYHTRLSTVCIQLLDKEEDESIHDDFF